MRDGVVCRVEETAQPLLLACVTPGLRQVGTGQIKDSAITLGEIPFHRGSEPGPEPLVAALAA